MWKFKGVKFLFISWFALFALTVIFFLPSVMIYNGKTAKYMSKIEANIDLDLKEKISIHGLNLIMSACAYPVYPKVLRESFKLFFKSNSG
jgi:hypothetical protein